MAWPRGDDDADIWLTLPQPQTVNKSRGLVAQAACGLDLKAGGRAASQAEALAGLPTGQVLRAHIAIDTTTEPDGVAYGGRWAG